MTPIVPASDDRAQADDQRDAGAVDQAAEDVAPDLVGPEQVAGRAAEHGRQQDPLLEDAGVRVVGRQQRRSAARSRTGSAAPARPAAAASAPAGGRAARPRRGRAGRRAAPRRRGRSEPGRSGRRAPRLGQPDPGVEHPVEQVDDQVDDHEAAGQREDVGHDEREVELLDGLDGQVSDPAPGEDRLDDDRAAEQVADVEPEDRDQRDRGVLERVLRTTFARAAPCCARSGRTARRARRASASGPAG